MVFLFLLIAGLTRFGVSGRAVNISGAWFLPQEGFPVFYRYFGDKVTWNEAEAVCGFHHADLLSVQTGLQMDAARAYLKEIDVTDNVWIGLQKESPEKPFSWTNGEKLLGEGYWIEPVPKTNEKLCAAIDPVSDFRWSSFYCRGPQVASFVCELPVPEWAKKDDGCMITSLPSLTVTLVPEVGVVQLFSDCGLDGTRRIACKGGVNREEIIRRLSCDVDAFSSTIFSKSTTDAATNGHPSTRLEGNDRLNRVEVSQTKSWDAYAPQTRHRRNANSSRSSTALPARGRGKEEGSTQAPSTQGRGALNVPYIFPHSPHSPSERNSPSKKKMRRPGGLVTTKKPEEASAAFPPSTEATEAAEASAAPPKESPAKAVPVLIIAGEKLDEAAAPDPGTPTSENPPIVLVIENREDSSPYLVPLADDVILNNPSLSPVEVINVDLVEVDNFTAANATWPPSAPSNRSLGRAGRPEEGTDAAEEGRTPTVPPETSTPDGEEAKGESANAVEREDKEGGEAPQRPNRGRLLTHPNHPSFYPRFLNRVLG